ncbi:hypothetical protein CAEBREN_19091 [Caenorhabditis brenneri]|uniref:Bromodomain adjacent to zinc finger domain protein 1A n=1 Tax=Caenorhabditis brenneri TaxID=135651 RepID=G0MMX9_CAEBE|nr:hypothetical protein CAEBREN_19091 [Caenorhabditis brenneri]
MPLLNKTPFQPDPPPRGIVESQRVIYMTQTNEIFENHDSFFKRIMQMNSTVWSCSQTRRNNLTFYEAIKSETEVEKEIQDFPEFLERPILLIVQKYTNRGRFEDLLSDIYHIMKDRFFINEEVFYSERSRKLHVKILTSYTTEAPRRTSGGGQQMIDENLEDEEEAGTVAETTTSTKEPIMQPAEVYRYNLLILDEGVAEAEKYREHVTADKIFRPKSFGARQKIRLFLKHTCQLSTDSDRYTVRDEFLHKISNLLWNDVMGGAEPVCPQTPVQQRGRIPNMLKAVGEEKKAKKDTTPRPRGRPPQTPEQRAQKQKEKRERKRQEAGKEPEEDLDLTQSGALTLTTSPAVKKVRRSSAKNEERKKAKIQEQQVDLDFYFSEARRLGINFDGLEQGQKLISPKKVAEFKQRVKEGKEAEREQQKEEKRRKIREKAAYNKKRDDLLCDDLKPMPKFARLELPEWMTNDEFGDYIFILQFFSTFKEILPLEEIRGTQEIFSFSEIVLAIKCHDPQNSPFADLMRVLLSIRRDICEEEDGDEADCNNREESYLINTQNCDPVNGTHGEMIREIGELHFRIRKIHGKSVRHLPVDWMTLTEVLRLIFETSGYYTGINTHRHRLYARGNFRGYEDPAYEFRVSQPEIMEKMKTLTVFDLEPNERMEIVKAIIYQLLTYSKFRTYLEKCQNELTDLKREQKRLKTWDVGQEGEASASRLLWEFDNTAVKTETPIAKRLKAHLKAHIEGRRYDKEDFDKILLDAVPYGNLSLDEIVTTREIQKLEYKNLMDTVTQKLFQAYCKVSDIRLGSDRAYRRYLVLDNLSAILIENPSASELNVSCSEPTHLEHPESSPDPDSEVFACSGNVETCQVHGVERNNRPRWEYIQNKETFERLQNSLNPRGNREVELAEELVEYKQNLLEILEDTEFLTQQSSSESKSSTWHSLLMTNEPDPGDTYNIDWDQEIREILLEFEEKLDQGLMGSLEKTFKVSRDIWRDTLQTTGDVSTFLRSSDADVELEETISDAKKLAVAFFMIIRSINLKFIKPPYISPTRDEHGNLKPSELFNRWQKALLQTDSHSAVSLFITTFESSIKWDKSRLQGKCKSCRRKATIQELVLCTGCDSCYHLKCAKLSEPPATEWLCQGCRAQQRMEEKRKLKLDAAHLQMHNMSIDDADVSSSSLSAVNSIENNGIIKTASGRAVKKIQYSEIHEGLGLKNRKSNGSVNGHSINGHATMMSTPTTSERPQRNVSAKIFDMNNENGLTDDDSDASDDENPRKRKIPVKKSFSSTSSATAAVANGSPRVIPNSSNTPNNKIKEKMGQIEQLLKETMRQECSWPFLQPVDAKEVPDYYDVIKRPMDLRTMMNKIKQRIYNKPAEIRSDFHLILANCETYNETESEIYQLSQQLDAFVSERLDAIIDR